MADGESPSAFLRRSNLVKKAKYVIIKIVSVKKAVRGKRRSGMKKRKGYWFIFLFAAILFYPLYGAWLAGGVELSGVTESEEKPVWNLEKAWSGELQTEINTYFEQNFGGRQPLIRLRGQLLYSLVNESPNRNVVIGKNKNLYEDFYILTEESAQGSVSSDEYFVQLQTKLESFAKLLRDNGKELYLFITPSKAHFTQEDIPWRYALLQTDQPNNLAKFREVLNRIDIPSFVARDYMEAQKESVDAPYFYTTGIHWSRPWGVKSVAAFYEMMQQHSRFDLGEILVEYGPYTGEIQWPDADLYQSLNLLKQPDEAYYSAEVKVVRQGEKPNVFCRGGSFMGQSWNALVYAGCFGKDLHYENNYYFTNQYSSKKTVSSFTAYDETTDWIPFFQDADIVVLEINEAKIGDASFGFMDYVLEHDEILSR